MQEELDILKLGHAEELETLSKEIAKKTDMEAQLRKQLLDIKSLEPSIQIVEKKLIPDSKMPDAKPEEKKANDNSGSKDSPPPRKEEPSSEKKSDSKRNDELRKSQGGFLSSMANFFLTDNERKKIDE